MQPVIASAAKLQMPCCFSKRLLRKEIKTQSVDGKVTSVFCIDTGSFIEQHYKPVIGKTVGYFVFQEFQYYSIYSSQEYCTVDTY